MNRRLYALHRWLSAIAFLQLAVWTMSGTFFTLFDIADVRGGFEKGAHDATLPANPGVVSPTTALAVAAQHGLTEAERLELRAQPQGIYYLARKGSHTLRIDARSGAVAPVSGEEADEIARRDQTGRPAIAVRERLAEESIEYRGKPLPAWRVRVADRGETDIYVDATTGEVTARRNRIWRTYDFLWSLHIMDYRGRESFHHPLIMVAAALAIATVLSGATLWGLRLVRRIRRGGDASPT